MKPVVLPLGERVGRFVLHRRGVQTRWVDTPYGRIHAYDGRGGGSLPPVVLLHGIGSAATPFGPLLERLRPHVRRVIAPDLPGHGFSTETSIPLTPEVLFQSASTALDALIDRPAIVVGNSLGGAVALRYALARPERVRALVLVSPAGARATDEEWSTLRSRFDLGSRGDALAFLDRLYHRTPWFVPLVAHELPAMLDRKSVRDLLASASNDDALSPEALGSLTMPILLVWGKSERLLPDSHFEYFASSLPGHALVERPEGFGHCPHGDAPHALAARIVDFARNGT